MNMIGAALPQSRLARLVATVSLVALIVGVGFAGCHDSLPVAPIVAAPAELSASRAPTDAEYAQMPAEFQQAAQILDAWVDAGFIGNEAYGSAYMRYLANYGRITLPITLLYNNSEVTSTTGIAEETHFLPMIRELHASASLGVSGSCGHTINAHALFNVHNQFFLNKGWLTWGAVTQSLHTTKSQPACSCSGKRPIQDAEYDPYSSDQGESACGSDGGGGTSGGSGTQYSPGDHTGGETVGWDTGMGNGGWSACGSDAVVDYVCIDYWDGGSQTWIEWSCGYVTTCGYTT